MGSWSTNCNCLLIHVVASSLANSWRAVVRKLSTFVVHHENCVEVWVMLSLYLKPRKEHTLSSILSGRLENGTDFASVFFVVVEFPLEPSWLALLAIFGCLDIFSSLFSLLLKTLGCTFAPVEFTELNII